MTCDLLWAFMQVKNPWPNVDAHSGVLLNHFGLTEARCSLDLCKLLDNN